MNTVERVRALGQSFWLDYIRRDLLESGELQGLIADGLVQGMTSNPTIFEQAIAQGNLYRSSIRPLAQAGWSAGDILDSLTLDDIRAAADLFRPLYESTSGRDGFVSIEVSPLLANDTEATADEARRLWSAVNRPNVMVKIPATAEGIPAIESSVADGININITLIFSLALYAQVMEAYLRGLEARAGRGESLDHIASVASFFVSRVDTLVDSLLEKILRGEGPKAERAAALRGKAAIANARLAYAQYQSVFLSPRFDALRARGANVQRPLWASTSTKNPAYPATVYVDNLIGADTVNTLPRATLDAFLASGKAEATLETGLSDARAQLEALASLGISMEAVTQQLERDGVAKFSESFQSLLATIESQRQTFQQEVAPLQGGLQETLARLDREEAGRRLWAEDPSLWPEGQDDARTRLGWLHLPTRSVERLAEISRFADQARSGGIRQAVLLGMGGSSLAPDVMARMGLGDDRVHLHVLDTIDPRTVRRTLREAPTESTLVLVSSKSGTTVEPLSLLAIFWDRAEKEMGERVGAGFAAITDPGTPLEAEARRRNFRALFESPADLGGRYSALSEFGLVPAALIGLDTRSMLEGASRMARNCGPNVTAAHNPGLFLGAMLGAAAAAGRDKITLVADPGLEPFPDWIEQLIAESSGKGGRGLFPVIGEPLGSPKAYGADRLIVYLRADGSLDRKVQAFVDSEAPVVVIEVGAGATGLGAEFFRWEVATAIACHLLDVNAFDQPDVQRAKDRASAVLRNRKAGDLPTGELAWKGDGLQVWAHHLFPSGTTLRSVWETILSQVGERDSMAFLAYLPPTASSIKSLGRLRRLVRDRMGRATASGFGPRYLHSTGQLYKGGPDRVVAVYIVGPVEPDLAVPDQDYTLATLLRAQAIGDFEAMHALGRRTYAFVLDTLQDLAEVESSLGEVLEGLGGAAPPAG